MTNEISISTKDLGLTATRQLAAILEGQTGFKYDTQIWAHVVDKLEEFTCAAGDNGDNDALDWLTDYANEPADEILEDISGFWYVRHALWVTADKVKADPDNNFTAGEFDALAKVASEMIGDECRISTWSAYTFIYRHYGIEY